MEVRFRRGDEIHRLVSDSLKRVLDHLALAKPHEEVVGVRETVSPYSVSPVIISDEEVALAPTWQMVGQLKGTYLVMASEDGVMIVDQHAAHERILYERLQAVLQGRKVPQQPFLIPQPVEVKREDMELLLGHRADLARVGLALEEFGEKAVAVTSIPSFLQGENMQSLLEALSEELAEEREGDTLEQVFDRACVFLACRGAIKANRRLQEEEVQSLLREWEEAGRPATCPHGRPLFVKWSWRELESWFKRS